MPVPNLTHLLSQKLTRRQNNSQCLLFADSIESFQTALGKYATEVLADVPNFSNVKPIILVGGVVGGSQA